MKTIGVITKTHGFEGAVVVRSQGGTAEPKPGEPVFIVIDGLPVPFFTREAWSPAPGTLVISFDDYLTTESVSAFKGCEVRATDNSKADEAPGELKDYMLIDRDSSFRGIITSVKESPGQIMAEVTGTNGTVLIPLHPDLIISIDHRKKIIEMSLPSGLTSVND
ncbi:MAG: hypothetical protein E4G92_04430 [Bacteroidia bacterium]|nr:MAG: hypothetical protein E4G92_04430 [Bacteroidia bacterium]